MFSLPRPLGTGMPDPAGFRLARLEIRGGEITGAIQPVSLREMPDPDPISLFDHAYPHGSPEVDEERAQFAKYQSSFAGEAH